MRALNPVAAPVERPHSIWTADRVVQRPITELRPSANNICDHSAMCIGRLKASVTRLGLLAPLLVEGDGTIVTGHGRYEAAKALGLATVPTIMADHLNPAKVRALRIADNRLAELS